MKHISKSTRGANSNQRIHSSFPAQGIAMPSYMGAGYPGQGVPPNVAPNEAMSNTPSAFANAGNAPAFVG